MTIQKLLGSLTSSNLISKPTSIETKDRHGHIKRAGRLNSGGFLQSQPLAREPRPSCPQNNLLDQDIAEDELARIRWHIAYNPNIPVDILQILATDSNSLIRKAVARNLQTSTETLRVLAEDRNDRVRWQIANNPHTPLDILITLAEDENDDIRWAIANNTSTPLTTLKNLIKDRNSEVCLRAIEQVNRISSEYKQPIAKRHYVIETKISLWNLIVALYRNGGFGRL